MKRLLLGEPGETLLTTLDHTLKHWGYRTLGAHRQDRLPRLIRDTSPDLLIISADWLAGGYSGAILDSVSGAIDNGASLIVLQKSGVHLPVDLPHEPLDIPVDIFALFCAIQRHLEKFPRQNMRLTVKLPGMICRHYKCHLGEILSLSSRGLFMKTGFRLDPGETFRIVLPLLGMKRELELTAKVLYCVHPEPKNNYLQGVGVEFIDLQPGNSQLLERYIETYFMEELCHQKSFYGWPSSHVGEAGGAVLQLPTAACWETPLVSQAN